MASASQRRPHFRLIGSWPCTMRQVDDSGMPGEPFRAVTVDLSAGGMLVISDVPIWRPTRVAIELELDGEALRLRGMILRATAREGDHVCAIRFSGVSPEDRMALTRFVFSQARELGQAAGVVRVGRADWWRLHNHAHSVEEGATEAPEAEPGAA